MWCLANDQYLCLENENYVVYFRSWAPEGSWWLLSKSLKKLWPTVLKSSAPGTMSTTSSKDSWEILSKRNATNISRWFGESTFPINVCRLALFSNDTTEFPITDIYIECLHLGPKWIRFQCKTDHTPRKLLYFMNWHNAESRKIRHKFRKENVWKLELPKNVNSKVFYLKLYFYKKINLKKIKMILLWQER